MPTINLDDAVKEIKKAIDDLANAENDDAEIKLKLQEVVVYGQHRLGEFASEEEAEEDEEDEDFDDDDEDAEFEDEECEDCGELIEDCTCDDDEDEDEDDEED